MNDKQLQIVEMAKDICRVQQNCNDVCKPISACDALRYAERAVEAGYVKVVRCKDCVFLERTDAFGDCTLYDEHVSKYPNDFCSDGKRKETVENESRFDRR